MKSLKTRATEAYRLIASTTKRVEILEPDSPLWRQDLLSLKELIQDQQRRIRDLESKITKLKMKK